MPLYECSDTVYRTSAAKAKTQTSPAAGASESQPRSTIGSKILPGSASVPAKTQQAPISYLSLLVIRCKLPMNACNRVRVLI